LTAESVVTLAARSGRARGYEPMQTEPYDPYCRVRRPTDARYDVGASLVRLRATSPLGYHR